MKFTGIVRLNNFSLGYIAVQPPHNTCGAQGRGWFSECSSFTDSAFASLLSLYSVVLILNLIIGASSLLLSPSLSLYMKICFSFSLETFFFLLEVSASQTQTAMYTNENQRLLVSVPDFIPFLLRYSFHVKMKNIPNNDRGGGQGCSYCVPVMKVFRDGENTGLWFLSAVSFQQK